MTVEKLKELLGKVERATGPDREIDEALMSLSYVRAKRHIGAEEDSGPNGEWVRVKERVWVDPQTDKWVSTAPLNFTSSVDAALALVERLQPGWRWGVASVAVKTGEKTEQGYPRYSDGFRAHVTEASALRPMPSVADATTAPLALLSALLKSLENQNG